MLVRGNKSNPKCWVPGQDLGREMRAEYYRQLGALTAQLHNHAEQFAPPPGFALRKMDIVFPFDHGNFLEKASDPLGLVTSERRILFESVAVRVKEVLDTLYASSHPPFVLHADLHQWNIRVHRGQVSALDFDDSMIGHPVQDIAITYYYIQAHPDYVALKDAYRTGYETLRPWPVADEAQLATLIAWRELDLLNFGLYTDNPQLQTRLPAFIERAEGRLHQFSLQSHL